MAKREPSRAEKLLEWYKEFAHSRTIPYYWRERDWSRLYIWGKRDIGYKTRRDGLSLFFVGLILFIPIALVAYQFFIDQKLGGAPIIFVLLLVPIVYIVRGLQLIFQKKKDS